MKSYRDVGYGGGEGIRSTRSATGINTAPRSFGRIIITSLSYMKTTTCRSCMATGGGGEDAWKERDWTDAEHGWWIRSRDTHCEREI
jgi:hypothetical protein